VNGGWERRIVSGAWLDAASVHKLPKVRRPVLNDPADADVGGSRTRDPRSIEPGPVHAKQLSRLSG